MTSQTVGHAVARRDKETQVISWLRQQQDDIAMAAATHIKPAAIIRVTQGALRRNDKLMAAAIANPQSLLSALLDAARLGHEPDTDDYYLVPFGNEVTGIEGYKGIIERMFRAGGVTSVVAQVVRQKDGYRPRGENAPPLHEYDDFADPESRGPLKGAYAYAILASGQCSQVIRMGRAEIMEHKAKSRGSDKADSPWQCWPDAMWKKTALRALEPYVPTSTEYRTIAARAGQPVPQTIADVRAEGPGGIPHEATAITVRLGPDEIVDAVVIPDDEPAADVACPPALASDVNTHFKRLGFTAKEHEQVGATAATLAGRGEAVQRIADLTEAEAARVREALEGLKDRAALVALLAGGEPAAQDSDNADA